MAEFKKTIPKEEVIVAEVKEVITEILSKRISVTVEKAYDDMSYMITVKNGKETSIGHISNEKLTTLEVHQNIRKVCEDLAATL
jgi:hypothetical protein